MWRLGWAAGAGVEAPVAPHWTARLEYLFTDYGNSGTTFLAGAQRFDSDLMLHEIRAGLNYQFGNDVLPANTAPIFTKAPATPALDTVNFHGQFTFTWQGYPAIRSAFQGTNSLPAGGQGRETIDATLTTGVRLWRGAEFWVDPEIDQGHRPSGYARRRRIYRARRRTNSVTITRTRACSAISCGKPSISAAKPKKSNRTIHQFAGSQTENRLVLTVGKFAVVDLFDTNRYANNPKSDFLNWTVSNAGTFDYAGDAWGYTYGAAAEWYQGIFTLRGGVFDLSASPAGAALNAAAYGLDPTFHQFQLVGEIEERHQLWGEPGKLKVTAFLSRGNAGSFANGINLAQTTGIDPSLALALVRTYQSRPGVSVNLEQQVTETLGVFARAGWADGNVEPWDFTDVDRTVSGGVSINGKNWGRPDDTVGIAGVINGIAPNHQAYFNIGGLGILIGDGALPNYGLEQIIEAYYSYALTASTRVSFDYQFIANPGYNADRGPANVFAGRFHSQF